MNLAETEWRLGGVMLLLMVVLFVVDTITPHGFTDHVLYATVVLIATASHHVWMPSVVAGIGSVLIMVGMIMSPASPGLPPWMPFGNRIFTVTVLWILVWFAWKRRQAETALKEVNMAQEAKIVERTHDLADVNRALVSEITERMHTEQAYRRSEGRLASILDMAEDAIIVTDKNRTVTLFNQGAARLFGHNADEILGHSLDLLLPERFRGGHSRHIEAFTHSPETARRMAQRRDVFGLKRDGTEFPAEASISKLKVGEDTTFTVIVRDITERRQTERQLRSLTTQLMTAQEEERRRISRELHDDINQRLALLAIKMGRLEASFPVLLGAARQAFQSLAQQLAAISDDVRQIAYQLHPSILDDLGLSAALEQLANAFSANTGIKTIVVQEDFGESLPRDIASCLYRIVQESLTNVRKHANASRVELELTCDGQDITLCIRDSGVGFDLERIRNDHRSLGLVNMRERVQSVHGCLEIQAEPGQGTRILVQIPLPGAHHEPTASPIG
jgi:PAS domain S-box-containing protein